MRQRRHQGRDAECSWGAGTGCSRFPGGCGKGCIALGHTLKAAFHTDDGITEGPAVTLLGDHLGETETRIHVETVSGVRGGAVCESQTREPQTSIGVRCRADGGSARPDRRSEVKRDTRLTPDDLEESRGTAHVLTPKRELSGTGRELRGCTGTWGKEKGFQRREKIICRGPDSSGTLAL